MKALIIALVVLLVLGFAVGGKFISVRNQLAIQKVQIDTAWANIDADLQRRSDLIPNLVETVKGYAKEETTVFKNIADARAAMMGARTPQEKIEANSQVNSALGRLFVIAENYPNLKANENFMRLQDELAGTENRILVSRRRYNEAVQAYNTSISLFPNNIVASMSGFQPNTAYFKTDAGARDAPKVAF